MNIYQCLLYVILALPLYSSITGQNCVFLEKSDFENQKCSTKEKPYIDRVIEIGKTGELYLLKSERTNKRIKKAFAVTIDGNIFYNLSDVSSNLAKKDRLNIGNNQNMYLMAISRGTYDYMEYDNSAPSGPGAGIGTGGIGLGMSFNIGGSPIRGIIYDDVNKEFNVFKNCKNLNEFLQDRHPDLDSGCSKKKLKIGNLRSVIEQLNGGQQNQIVVTDSGPSKEILLYPHRSMGTKECIIFAEETKFDFDGYDVLELTIPCEGASQFCVNEQQICLDISCEDESNYYIVEYDRESKEYSIALSNPDDFKYYSALMERRKKNKK